MPRRATLVSSQVQPARSVYHNNNKRPQSMPFDRESLKKISIILSVNFQSPIQFLLYYLSNSCLQEVKNINRNFQSFSSQSGHGRLQEAVA